MLKSLFFICFFIILAPVTQCYAVNHVNAFIYHRFDESRYPSTNISSKILIQQLEELKRQQLEVISLGEVSRRLEAGGELPEHAAALSIDDAFRSTAVAFPIFRKYGFPVTLFVNTSAVGSAGYLSWDELKKLQDEGVEIGNHTSSHDYLVELKTGETFPQWQKRVRADIEKAQAAFEKHLGRRPELFVYPYGEYSPEVVAIVKSLGFKAAYAQQSGVISNAWDRYILPRFPMGGPFATLEGFKTKLAMQPLPVTAVEPFDPVVKENPPVLTFKFGGPQVKPAQFNCFVQGENSCRVENDSQGRSGWYRIVAERPLSGRRNKYTLTLHSKEGWFWYSHLWVNAKNPVTASK